MPGQNATMARLCVLICLLAPYLPAQGQAALKMVDGHPLIRATLRSGSQSYEGHLLLDLSLPAALVLHPRAADALVSPVVELVSGGVRLRGLHHSHGD